MSVVQVSVNHGLWVYVPDAIFFPAENFENFQSIVSAPINNEESTVGKKKKETCVLDTLFNN